MQKLPFKLPSGNLSQRVLSAVVLLPIVLFAVKEGGWFYNLLIISAAMIGMLEWLGLTAKEKPLALESVGLMGLFSVLLTGWFFGWFWAGWLFLVVFAAFCFFAWQAHPVSHGRLDRVFLTVAGLPYLAGGAWAFMDLRAIFYMGFVDIGFFAIVYLLAVVWATDIGGYAFGCSIGGPKLCPKISPKKTWAGLVGGMASAGLAGFCVAWFFGDPKALLAGAVALGLAVVAQAGDLFESHVKRRAGVKDSGTLIPGHGGMLDRIDGLWLAAIAMQLLMLWKR